MTSGGAGVKVLEEEHEELEGLEEEQECREGA